MKAQPLPTLESMHHKTGTLLMLGQRLLSATFILGTMFCMFAYGLAEVIRQPEAYLHMQGFMFNYAEMAQGEAAPYMKVDNLPVLPEHPTDPNWDGTLAGASAGYTVGQNIPFIGSFCGPVLGAILGYRLDSRI